MELDRHAFVIRGDEATVRWGYRLAARLVRWSFAGSGSAGGMVTATVGWRDAFRLSQAPLTLVLCLEGHVDGPATVRWPVVGVVEDGAAIRVTVGPCERTSRDG